MEKKQRLDLLLIEQKHYSSRAKAQAAIKAGHVIVASTDTVLTKPSMQVATDTVFRIIAEETTYVSRGGLKLAAAIDTFQIDCKGKIALDIGASTGGFSDVLLQNGAKCVYALDVGTDQLVEALREDDRVISLEQTNFRYITRDIFTRGLPELIVTDVSFISLTLIIDKLAALLADTSFSFIGLIKPQFELEKHKVGKKGVIRDEKVQKQAVEKIKTHIVNLGKQWQIQDVIPAPVRGTKGNQEFLIYVEHMKE